MSGEKPEEWNQMCERLAYYLMQGIARGDGAVRMADVLASAVLNWQRVCADYEKAQKKNGN